MHYVIYPDTLFMENLICNLLFLSFLKGVFLPAARWKRILLSGVLSAVCNTLVSILFFRCIWILQLGVLFPAAGGMILGCLEIRERRRFFYLFYQMTLWTLVLGGVLQTMEDFFALDTAKHLWIVGIFTGIFWSVEKIFENYKRQQRFIKDVTLVLGKKSCRIRGFADSGNQLFDPVSKKPVSILTKHVWNTLTEKESGLSKRVIPYKSVGNPGGVLMGVQIDYMVIGSGKEAVLYEKPIIAITEEPFLGSIHYSILLHNEYC